MPPIRRRRVSPAYPYAEWLGGSLSERLPASVAAERWQLYAEVARAATEQPLPVGGFPELGSRKVRGALLPLSAQHVAVVFEVAPGHVSVEDETRKLNAFLDSIIENIPAMVFVKDAEHLRYEVFNRAGEALTGFKRADIYGKSSRDLFPPEQAEFFLAKDRAVLAGGRMLDIPEEPIDTPLGKHWLHTKKIPIVGLTASPATCSAFRWILPSARRRSWPWSVRTPSWSCACFRALAS